jgi:hypothetical protein
MAVVSKNEKREEIEEEEKKELDYNTSFDTLDDTKKKSE